MASEATVARPLQPLCGRLQAGGWRGGRLLPGWQLSLGSMTSSADIGPKRSCTVTRMKTRAQCSSSGSGKLVSRLSEYSTNDIGSDPMNNDVVYWPHGFET